MKIVLNKGILIRPPFWDCPSCKQPNSFGRLAVNDYHYIRKCKICLHASLIELPPLEKRVIYIDQFAVSEMAKALANRGGRPGKLRDAFYVELFDRLDRLGKLMLLVCPYSPFHLNESKAIAIDSPEGLKFEVRFQQIRLIFDHLSFGTKFLHFETIRESQVLTALELWLKGDTAFPTKFNSNDAVTGKINVWLDDPYPALDSRLDQDEVRAIYKTEANLQRGLEAAVTRWRGETNKRFRDWFEEEIDGHRSALLKAYQEQKSYLQELQSRLKLPRMPCSRNPAADLMLQLLHTLEDHGCKSEKCEARAVEFLNSKVFSQIPTVRIGAALWAGLTHRLVHSGQNSWATSFANDTRLLSAYLPYCDAMFVDNACADMLRKAPAKHKVPEGSRVYSMATKDEFLAFLKEVEASASSNQAAAKVREVYGDNWLAPSSLYLTQRLLLCEDQA